VLHNKNASASVSDFVLNCFGFIKGLFLQLECLFEVWFENGPSSEF